MQNFAAHTTRVWTAAYRHFRSCWKTLCSPVQIEPAYALHPAAVAMHRLFWSGNYVEDIGPLFRRGADRRTTPARRGMTRERQLLYSEHQVQRGGIRRQRIAGISLPLERTVEFLVAAGIFVCIS